MITNMKQEQQFLLYLTSFTAKFRRKPLNLMMYSSICGRVIKSPYADVEIPDTSLSKLIWKNYEKWSNRVAIKCIDTNSEYTYHELRQISRQFCKYLTSNGYQKGQVLSIMLPNRIEYPAIMLGGVEAGLVVSTLNPLYTHEEAAHQLKNSNSVLVVTLEAHLDKINKAKNMIADEKGSQSSLKIVSLDGDSKFYEFMRHEAIILDDGEPEVNGDDVALLPFSSGTTGLPKGVQLTHRNIVSNLLQMSYDDICIMRKTTDTYQDIVPVVLPFFHIFGITNGILLSLLHGAKIIALSKFEPKTYLSAIKEEKASIIYAVPSLIYFLNSYPAVESSHFSSVHTCFAAGGSTPVTEFQKLVELSNGQITIRHAYGLTEASPCVSFSCPEDELSTVGQLVPNTAVKIIGPDGSLKAADEPGEICVKGPQVMKGYLNNPEATDAVIDSNEFLHTGDVGYYNEEGYLFFVDRFKEIIKVKGYQVSPTELEAVIKSYPGVNDVGVIGVKDGRNDEKPIAFVSVVEESKMKFDQSSLISFVSEKVAPYKRISDVILVDSIPRNQSGKILRQNLRELFTNNVSS